MRHILGGARRLTGLWLGVSVPREANGDADRLSHPDGLAEVVERAEGVGLRVHVAEIPAECWECLRGAT
eukprot:6186967-Pleurochrysis_carterae.AAC.1